MEVLAIIGTERPCGLERINPMTGSGEPQESRSKTNKSGRHERQQDLKS
jgi:hypothetical protein